MSARHLLLLLTLTCTAAAVAQTAGPPGPPQQQPAADPQSADTPLAMGIKALLDDPAVARAHWGIAVTTLDGTPVYGLDETKLFRPASTAKLFTTTAAMALLGPAATVTTTVLADGRISDDGALQGNLIFHGAGDANLSGRQLPYQSPAERKRNPNDGIAQTSNTDPLSVLDDLVTQISAHGIKQITGQIVGDESLWPHEPYPTGWEVDDLVWGYAAPVSALALNDNQMQLTLAPSTGGSGFLASISPDVGYLSQSSQQTAVNSVPAKAPAILTVDLEGLQRQTLKLQGQLPSGSTRTEDIAILEPALFAAEALHSRLAARGIPSGAAKACTGEFAQTFQSFSVQVTSAVDLHAQHLNPVITCGSMGKLTTVLASHNSAPLAEDITVTLKESLNLHAEMLLRRLGAAYGESGSFAQGARVVHQWLTQANIPATDFVLYDGSGLSSHDLVTPRAEAQLLAYAATQPWFPQWKAALPLGGVDGTLASRFTEPALRRHVFAKTGTLGESRALAGYLQCASGRELIFSIMVDNHSPGTSADRTAMDRIVAAIAAAN